MIGENLNQLIDRVQRGDHEAADRLRRVMRPVVSRQVRQVLESADYATPLGQRVEVLLHASGTDALQLADGIEPAVRAIAQVICGEKIAQLQSRLRPAVSAAETVCC
jgi:hypothetical protein